MMTVDSLLPIKKVLLHTHLEGSLTLDTLKELKLKNNIDLCFDVNQPNFTSLLKKDDWNTFRKIFYNICDCFQTKDDFYLALLNYGLKLKNEEVIYAEVQFSPWRHISRNLNIDDIYTGLLTAIIELEKNHNLYIRLICDIVRNPKEDVNRIIDWLLDTSNKFIVGLGISGGTGAIPRINYKKYCERAKNAGFFINVHAGELEDSTSVFEAVNYLLADRIGHGISLVENSELISTFSNTHFELCPSASNFIGLGKDNYESIKQMIAVFNNYSINTDDELIFNTCLTDELQKLLDTNILTLEKIIYLQKNSIYNAFLTENMKKKLLLILE